MLARVPLPRPHIAHARVPSCRAVTPALAPLACLLLLSCGPAIRPDFNSPEPAARNAAVVQAASTHDQESIPNLVRMLDADDPATRFLAIHALERLTGDRLGYDHDAPEAERQAAVERWRARVNDFRPR